MSLLWNLALGSDLTFYKGLMRQTKLIVDAAVRGPIMTKTYDEAYELMKKFCSQPSVNDVYRTLRKAMLGVIQMDAFNALLEQLSALSKQMQHLANKTHASTQAKQVMSCDFYN